MKRLSISQQKRLTALEVERKPQVANAYMCVHEMPTVDEWEKYAVMQQRVLVQRARHEGPIPDEVVFPYPDELIEYYKNQKWEYIA